MYYQRGNGTREKNNGCSERNAQGTNLDGNFVECASVEKNTKGSICRIEKNESCGEPNTRSTFKSAWDQDAFLPSMSGLFFCVR